MVQQSQTRPIGSLEDSVDHLTHLDDISGSRGVLLPADDNFSSQLMAQQVDSKTDSNAELAASNLKLTEVEPKQVKSISGFKTGYEGAVDNFFSGMRMTQETNEKADFIQPATQTGKEYVKGLRKHHEEQYNKKFAYERGQFHQSIPIPKDQTRKNKAEIGETMITVQLVKKVLHEFDSAKSKESREADEKVFEAKENVRNVSQQYQIFNLE